MLRTSIWKDLSHFEDSTAKLISTIIATKTSPDHYYQLLIEQYQTLFTVLDLLFINQITRKLFFFFVIFLFFINPTTRSFL
jgi:hypothetical protein